MASRFDVQMHQCPLRRYHEYIHSASRSKPPARTVFVCLSLSVSLSVCLSRAGHTDEHTHDVNDALSPYCITSIASNYLRSHMDNHTHDII